MKLFNEKNKHNWCASCICKGQYLFKKMLNYSRPGVYHNKNIYWLCQTNIVVQVVMIIVAIGVSYFLGREGMYTPIIVWFYGKSWLRCIPVIISIALFIIHQYPTGRSLVILLYTWSVISMIIVSLFTLSVYIAYCSYD